jgi:hypothetical protein
VRWCIQQKAFSLRVDIIHQEPVIGVQGSGHQNGEVCQEQDTVLVKNMHCAMAKTSTRDSVAHGRRMVDVVEHLTTVKRHRCEGRTMPV